MIKNNEGGHFNYKEEIFNTSCFNRAKESPVNYGNLKVSTNSLNFNPSNRMIKTYEGQSLTLKNN